MTTFGYSLECWKAICRRREPNTETTLEGVKVHCDTTEADIANSRRHYPSPKCAGWLENAGLTAALVRKDHTTTASCLIGANKSAEARSDQKAPAHECKIQLTTP
jgi:hypothetical protein